jgi:hypothetical protein
MKKQKWRRLDAEGVKLFKEMLIMFSYRVDNPNIERAINEAISVKITVKLENEFSSVINFNESDTYEIDVVDHVYQAQVALGKHGITKHPLFAVKTMTDLWKLYSKEVK